jgi:hypothetical protein
MWPHSSFLARSLDWECAGWQNPAPAKEAAMFLTFALAVFGAAFLGYLNWVA